MRRSRILWQILTYPASSLRHGAQPHRCLQQQSTLSLLGISGRERLRNLPGERRMWRPVVTQGDPLSHMRDAMRVSVYGFLIRQPHTSFKEKKENDVNTIHPPPPILALSQGWESYPCGEALRLYFYLDWLAVILWMTLHLHATHTIFCWWKNELIWHIHYIIRGVVLPAQCWCLSSMSWNFEIVRQPLHYTLSQPGSDVSLVAKFRFPEVTSFLPK